MADGVKCQVGCRSLGESGVAVAGQARPGQGACEGARNGGVPWHVGIMSRAPPLSPAGQVVEGDEGCVQSWNVALIW